MCDYSHINPKEPIHVEATKGSNITDAICESIDIAKRLNIPIILEFNEITLAIKKESSVKDIVDLYFSLRN